MSGAINRWALLVVLLLTVTKVRPLRAEPTLVEESDWGADLAVQHYFIPEDRDLAIPVLSLTKGDLLIEGRYNYEARDALSLWLGRSFSFGQEWQVELIPMLGAVLAKVHGMAPGLKVDVTWNSFNLYSEMEYVFDFETRDNNFFYSWSEITYGLSDNLRVGIVGNRTRAYDSDVEVDRGPTISYDLERFSLSLTALNIDEDATIVAGFECSLTGAS